MVNPPWLSETTLLPTAGRHLSELDGGIGDGLIGGVGHDTGDGAADGLGMRGGLEEQQA